MNKNKYVFAVNSYQKAVDAIQSCINNRYFPIIYIKFFIINGLGPEWIKELNFLLEKKFSKKNFKIYVDCKKNYGLFISLVDQKISYIKINADKKTFKRLNEIAQKNKVLLNPKFSIVDLFKIKKINKKIDKILI